MDVNGLRISDEFRMRSPVVWISLVIVVLCALSAESRVQPSFHLIHGQAGPIFRTLIPANGYGNVIPQYIGRRVQPQHDEDYEDEEDEDEEDEDDEEYDPGYGYGGGGGGGGGPEPYPDEDDDDDEDEEDEEEDEDDGEGRDGDEIEGRQAFVNNQYVEPQYVPRPDNRVKQQNQVTYTTPNRVPVNNNRRPVQGNQNRPNNNNNQQRPNRRRPTPVPNVVHVVPQQAAVPQRQQQPVVPSRRQQQPQPQPISVPPKVTRAPVTNPPVTANNKQKLQLRPVATSTQFIATPVADLILRLSISIAKPVGHGNSTMFNVPIRIHQTSVKDGQNHVINLGPSRDDVEMPKSESVPVTSERPTPAPEKVREEDVEADDDEEEEEEKELAPAADMAVTEKQRK